MNYTLPALLMDDYENIGNENDEQLIIDEMNKLSQIINSNNANVREFSYFYRSYSTMEKWLDLTTRKKNDKLYKEISRFVKKFKYLL